MPLINQTFSQIITFIRGSGATYFDATGTLQTAATDIPRFDYNPATLAAQGLLIEEARTNLALYSAEFNNAAWAKTNSSITANATAAPDGTTTADKLIEALDVNLVHQIGQSAITVVSLGTYTASVFVKADTRTRVRIAFLIAAGGGVVADANLTAGTIGAASAFGGGTAVGSSIQAINNGWYRISVSGSGAAGTSGELRIELLDSSGNRQYNGDGTSGLFVWGAQLEAGAFPTSYIPTTTIALTRSADVASVNTLSPWFNATAGTLFTESQQLPGQTAAVFPRIVVIDDGTTNNVILNLWRSDTSRLYAAVTSGGVNQSDVGTTGVTQTNNNRIAAAYATNDFAASVNGGAVSTDTSGTVPTGLTTLRLGRSSGTDQLNGWLRRVVYYPRRLSNAELQSITT